MDGNRTGALIKDHRDFAVEARASQRYEELRLLSEKNLAVLAGWRGPRQQMIATIRAEEPDGSE
jgi:hypothetical protein